MAALPSVPASMPQYGVCPVIKAHLLQKTDGWPSGVGAYRGSCACRYGGHGISKGDLDFLQVLKVRPAGCTDNAHSHS